LLNPIFFITRATDPILRGPAGSTRIRRIGAKEVENIKGGWRGRGMEKGRGGEGMK
jgi:hypothetical protein